MKTILLLAAVLLSIGSAVAQNHGSITFKGQIISLTGYRTRISDQKRWIIGEGKKDGKLYSITITLKPDVSAKSNVKTDATHTVTITTSNADYSNAENFCFDGGSLIDITPQGSNFIVSGKDVQSGNCFGNSKGTDKLSFIMKP